MRLGVPLLPAATLSVPLLRPKENSEWLLEAVALNIGVVLSATGPRVGD